jgi:hypothetical protein
LGDHCINLNSDVKIIFLPGSTDAPIYVIFWRMIENEDWYTLVENWVYKLRSFLFDATTHQVRVDWKCVIHTRSR